MQGTLRTTARAIAILTTLSATAVSIAATGCTSAGDTGSNDQEVVAAEATTKAFVFDFASNEGDHGFKGMFRDVPERQLNELLRRQSEGLDLGPVPPETESLVGTPAEDSHWFMNAGVHPVPDNDGVFGYLLQGVNRSDDMDKYMVREFGPADGLLPNTTYRVVINEAVSAANDRIGALGPGGAEARTFDVLVVDKDPYPFATDETGHVRFTDENRPSSAPEQRDGLGGTGVCMLAGSGLPAPPGLATCPTSGRVPYLVKSRAAATKTLSIRTTAQGGFWLMIGGHSGHESLDEYFIVKLGISITGELRE